MGNLDGIAGAVHLVDCLLGDSTLLVTNGCSPFFALPLTGQILTLLWCLVGPFAAITARQGDGDVGMIAYGAVEVGCAATVSATTSVSTSDLNPLANALLVQAVVVALWISSSSKASKEST